jgi:hypothetical protein
MNLIHLAQNKDQLQAFARKGNGHSGYFKGGEFLAWLSDR